MTLKEADEVAKKCLPVMYNGILYTRITRVGYTYDKEGKRNSFVQILDKNSNSVMDVLVSKVELADVHTK